MPKSDDRSGVLDSGQAAGPVTVFVAVGANLGDPAAQVRSALRELAGLSSTGAIHASSLYRTAPIGGPPQSAYVNAVASLQTELAPMALLRSLLAIEANFGRTRSVQDAPRTLDLDLLLYGGRSVDEPGLKVPHPRMHLRRFVLEPLREISPAVAIPGFGTVSECLARVADQTVERLEPDSAADRPRGG